MSAIVYPTIRLQDDIAEAAHPTLEEVQDPPCHLGLRLQIVAGGRLVSVQPVRQSLEELFVREVSDTSGDSNERTN